MEPGQKAPTVEKTAQGWRVRLRYGAGQRGRYFLAGARTEAEAIKKAALMLDLANRMVKAGKEREASRFLDRAAKTTDAKEMSALLGYANDVVSGKRVMSKRAKEHTFAEVADLWVTGKLQHEFPDDVRANKAKTAVDNAARLQRYINPVIGSLPVREVTMDDLEEVKRRLPGHLGPGGRRLVVQTMCRVITLAQYPLKAIERVPFPPHFVPKQGKTRDLQYLKPGEDGKLLGCSKVPFGYRLLWGFLCREGMRRGEAIRLTWGDFDLDIGQVRVDENKTSDPRSWKLDDGVWRALRMVKKQLRPSAGPSDPVFVLDNGEPIIENHLEEKLRRHLTIAGVAKARPMLLEESPVRRPIRVHDLRGSFVTVALSTGRNEQWVSDRTGHRSSAMIAKYYRRSREFTELKVTWFESMDQAIPELRALEVASSPIGPGLRGAARSSSEGGGPRRGPRKASVAWGERAMRQETSSNGERRGVDSRVVGVCRGGRQREPPLPVGQPGTRRHPGERQQRRVRQAGWRRATRGRQMGAPGSRRRSVGVELRLVRRRLVLGPSLGAEQSCQPHGRRNPRRSRGRLVQHWVCCPPECEPEFRRIVVPGGSPRLPLRPKRRMT